MLTSSAVLIPRLYGVGADPVDTARTTSEGVLAHKQAIANRLAYAVLSVQSLTEEKGGWFYLSVVFLIGSIISLGLFGLSGGFKLDEVR